MPKDTAIHFVNFHPLTETEISVLSYIDWQDRYFSVYFWESGVRQNGSVDWNGADGSLLTSRHNPSRWRKHDSAALSTNKLWPVAEIAHARDSLSQLSSPLAQPQFSAITAISAWEIRSRLFTRFLARKGIGVYFKRSRSGRLWPERNWARSKHWNCSCQ